MNLQGEVLPGFRTKQNLFGWKAGKMFQIPTLKAINYYPIIAGTKETVIARAILFSSSSITCRPFSFCPNSIPFLMGSQQCLSIKLGRKLAYYVEILRRGDNPAA